MCGFYLQNASIGRKSGRFGDTPTCQDASRLLPFQNVGICVWFEEIAGAPPDLSPIDVS
jgi:hypothetical protein